MNQSFFSKRIGRLEYFVFLAVPYVLIMLIGVFQNILYSKFQVEIINVLFQFVHYFYYFWLILFIVLSIKRLHDYNLNGFYILIPIILGIVAGVLISGFVNSLVLFLSVAIFSLKKGTVGPNNFGEDPVTVRV